MLNEPYCIADENRKTFERKHSIEPYVYWDGEKYSTKEGFERWQNYANKITLEFSIWLKSINQQPCAEQ